MGMRVERRGVEPERVGRVGGEIGREEKRESEGWGVVVVD